MSEDSTKRRYVCRKCQYSWYDTEMPALCPRCKSCRWPEGRLNRMICPYCTTMWFFSRKDTVCPSCGKLPTFRDKVRVNCVRCEYAWVQEGDRPVSKCPLCKTASWMEGSAITHICSMCGHSWRNKVRQPKRCPSCYSEMWYIPHARLQCKRCGHRWVSRNSSSESVTICPKCKSRKWMDPPILKRCADCGNLFATASGNRLKCGICDGSTVSHTFSCTLCGTSWLTDRDSAACPRCGTMCETRSEDRVLKILWVDGESSLRIETSDGLSVIYYLERGIPVSATYLSDAINLLETSAESLINDCGDPDVQRKLGRLAKAMYIKRDEYRDNICYLSDLLELDEFDASVLAIHFTGMGPEAIALKYGKTVQDIRASFDRIMKAYRRTGIIVNDSIFSADPFSEYRKQMDGE